MSHPYKIFWIKDYVDCGEVEIVHCLTECMKADTLSKPLQGTLFRKCWSEEMHIPDERELKAEQNKAPPSPRSMLEIPSTGSNDDVKTSCNTQSGLDLEDRSNISLDWAQSMRNTNTSVGKVSWNKMLINKKQIYIYIYIYIQ